MAQKPIEITGIKLESDHTGRRLTVFLEIEGEWKPIIETQGAGGGIINYIIEPYGIRLAVANEKPYLA